MIPTSGDIRRSDPASTLCLIVAALTSPRWIAIAAFAASGFIVGFTGCGIPHDPDGTIARVRGGVIRAGVTEQPPWTRFSGSDVQGVEAELLKELAAGLDARIQWTRASESELFELLEKRKLDVVIGGVISSTPWSHQAAVTQPYAEHVDPDTADIEQHVWAAAPGENRWLLTLDRFLQGRRGQAYALLSAYQP